VIFMADISTLVEKLWGVINGIAEVNFSDTVSKIFDTIDDIFGGYLYNLVVDLGDKAFGFFTPDSINDFDFSSMFLFIFGVAIVSIIIKIIQIFF